MANLATEALLLHTVQEVSKTANVNSLIALSIFILLNKSRLVKAACWCDSALHNLVAGRITIYRSLSDLATVCHLTLN